MDFACDLLHVLTLLDALPISAACRRINCGTRSRLTSSSAAPICARCRRCSATPTSRRRRSTRTSRARSEEHTSELQSPCNLVCRLLLEKKKEKYRAVLKDQSS